MDRPSRLFSPRPIAEMKQISPVHDLRQLHDGGPWSFIQPGGRCLKTQRRICQALAVLLGCGAGLITLLCLGPAGFDPLLLGGPALAGIAALFAGCVWQYRLALRSRRDGELAAAVMRREMARAPANDRLFAVVFRDVGDYLELLAFFQEGKGTQRLEHIRAPRSGDGSRYTETAIRDIRKVLQRHFSIAQIDALNVVPIARIDRTVEAEQRAQHRA